MCDGRRRRCLPVTWRRGSGRWPSRSTHGVPYLPRLMPFPSAPLRAAPRRVRLCARRATRIAYDCCAGARLAARGKGAPVRQRTGNRMQYDMHIGTIVTDAGASCIPRLRLTQKRYEERQEGRDARSEQSRPWYSRLFLRRAAQCMPRVFLAGVDLHAAIRLLPKLRDSRL